MRKNSVTKVYKRLDNVFCIPDSKPLGKNMAYDHDARGISLAFDDVYCKAESGNSILVDIEDEEYWIPKNQIHSDSGVYQKEDEGTLIITRWIAEQKDLV